jgi:outer membrane biosynthesis protein TonB
LRYGIVSVILFIFCIQLAFSQSYIPAKTISSTQVLKEFIDQSLIYPPNDLISRTEGDVIYEFKIDNTGRICCFKLLEGISEEANKESLRIIRKIQWQPAFQNGNPVESTHSFSITFNVKKYQRMLKKRPVGNNLLTLIEIDTTSKIFEIEKLDQIPVPLKNGIVISLKEYIISEMKYPEASVNLGIQGTVKLSMVIEEDGINSNIVVMNSVGGGCDNEAIRILQGIRWKPGLKDGKIVRTKSFFEVIFKLNENQHKEIPNPHNSGI